MSHLLLRNKLHLYQAWDTPCAQGPIKDFLGEHGLGQGIKYTIEGNFDPNLAKNLPKVNQWLKHHICHVAAPGSINLELTLEEYKDLMQNQDESTSSSPSGWHYGHYKAALVSDDISRDHARIMSIPFLAGFTPA
eukprot:4383144-Ditylum_brightwellii.AAC.1